MHICYILRLSDDCKLTETKQIQKLWKDVLSSEFITMMKLMMLIICNIFCFNFFHYLKC